MSARSRVLDAAFRLSESPITAVRATGAAQALAGAAVRFGHPGLAAAAGLAGALAVAVDAALHPVPAAPPGTYATFRTDHETDTPS